MARSATVLGLARLQKKLKRLPDATLAEIRRAMEEAAQDVVNFAKSLVPKSSGDLERSIGWTWGAPPRGSMTLGKVARSALGKQLTITIYAGNDKAWYARLVEFGTAPHLNAGLYPGTKHPGTRAQPFFYPAWRASKKGVRGKVRKAVRSAARAVAAGG